MWSRCSLQCSLQLSRRRGLEGNWSLQSNRIHQSNGKISAEGAGGEVKVDVETEFLLILAVFMCYRRGPCDWRLCVCPRALSSSLCPSPVISVTPVGGGSTWWRGSAPTASTSTGSAFTVRPAALLSVRELMCSTQSRVRIALTRRWTKAATGFTEMAKMCVCFYRKTLLQSAFCTT